MSLNIDKIDIEILGVLYAVNSTSSFCSSQIKEIQANCNVEVSYYTVVRRVQSLIDNHLVEEGFKYRNAKTYYLSEQGKKFIQHLCETENMDIRFKYQEYEDNEEE